MKAHFVIAGGGTGGHVFPAIAVAQALKKLNPSCEITFIGTERGLEHRLVPQAGFTLKCVRVSGVKGKSLLSQLKAVFQLPMAVYSCLKILRKNKTKAVLGVGGYASAPALMAALILRIPRAICEQNSIPGLTNRLLSHVASKIFGSFPDDDRIFPDRKFSLAGNPLRAGFEHRQQPTQRVKGRIVVIGGSLGATFLNEIVPAAAAVLKEKGRTFSIVHQTGAKEVAAVKERYEKCGVEAAVLPFIDDMLSCYLAADIVVCRAGATTCTELMALGIPSVLIPFPQAANDHQTRNAEFLTKNNAGLLMPQKTGSAEQLSVFLGKLLSDQEYRASMARQACALARLDAANHIARALSE